MKSARTFIRYARISPIGARSQGLGNRKIARAFWAKHDSTEYVDWSKAKRVQLAKLKPSTETISLRLPKYLLDSIRQIAKSPNRAMYRTSRSLKSGCKNMQWGAAELVGGHYR